MSCLLFRQDHDMKSSGCIVTGNGCSWDDTPNDSCDLKILIYICVYIECVIWNDVIWNIYNVRDVMHILWYVLPVR